MPKSSEIDGLPKAKGLVRGRPSNRGIRKIDTLDLTDAEMLAAIERCRLVTAHRDPSWASCFDTNRHCCVSCEEYGRSHPVSGRAISARPAP